jgi:RNA polymerase sigma-70 factor (ECF subfamily)
MNESDRMREELTQLGGGAHALAIQILGNPDDARDVVQDAFAVVLGRPDAYDASKGPLRPWFLRLVRNRCIDLLRSHRRTTSSDEEPADTSADPQTAAEIAQRDAALKAALNSLDAGQREIIVLRDYLDLSYAEIASVLDIAAGTVMSRLHRARIALGKAYRDRYDESI